MSFIKMGAATVLITCLSAGSVMAQSATATGGGAEGSASSVNGAMDGGMAKSSMSGSKMRRRSRQALCWLCG